MNATAERNTMRTMPPNARNAAMSHTEFRELLEAAELTTREAAALLGISHATVSRWQQPPPPKKGAKGGTPISAHSAKLIRLLIKPKKK